MILSFKIQEPIQLPKSRVATEVFLSNFRDLELAACQSRTLTCQLVKHGRVYTKFPDKAESLEQFDLGQALCPQVGPYLKNISGAPLAEGLERN
jgi:hypothetical protein